MSELNILMVTVLLVGVGFLAFQFLKNQNGLKGLKPNKPPETEKEIKHISEGVETANKILLII